MLHDPDETRLFPRFTPEQLRELSAYGTVEEIAPGEALYRQGVQPYPFFVVLDGEVRVTKDVHGEEWALAVHRAGQFAGELSLLTGSTPVATARAVGPVRALRIAPERVRELVLGGGPLAQILVTAMTGRVHEVDAQIQQQEKLTALGKMAAGLAHELNNPAAAVRRAAAQLEEAVAQVQQAAIRLHEHPLQPAQRAVLDRLHAKARAQCVSPLPMPPLERSAREDELGDWLDDRGITAGWEMTPVLVTGGVTPETLEDLEREMGAERMEPTVRWLAATLNAAALIRDVGQSADRISLLVGSIKTYSHMDQAPELREIDLRDGLESTLALMAHRLKQGVEVIREYDTTLPKVCAYAGELNQVWTNLVDNAVDAMGGKGRLWLRTKRVDAGTARVEIADDGPGIPAAVQERMWEPFFTTKGVGEGTGLGLDIARRIIRKRHGGDIRISTGPEGTRFCIDLLIAGPPKAAPSPSPEAVGEDGDADAGPGDEPPSMDSAVSADAGPLAEPDAVPAGDADAVGAAEPAG